MADDILKKKISELTELTSLGDSDWFAVQSGNAARKISGETIASELSTRLSGAVLMGLGELIGGTLFPSLDLNDYTTPGIYYRTSGNGISNWPEVLSTSGAFRLAVFRVGGNNNIFQYLIRNSSAKPQIVARVINSSGVTIWRQIAYFEDCVPNTRKVNTKPLSSDITLTAEDVGAIPASSFPTVSNRNLFDNGWFTVSQRNPISLIPFAGLSYSGSGQFVVDRWISAGVNPSGSVDQNGRISVNYGSLYQILDSKLLTFLNGKSVTASIRMASGSTLIYSQTVTLQKPTEDGQVFFLLNNDCPYQLWMNKNGAISIQPKSESASNAKIRAVKLEFGTTSTLEYDAIQDYGTELLRCQRYYQRIETASNQYALIGTGFCYNNTSASVNKVIARITVPLPVPLRIFPTWTTSSSSGLNNLRVYDAHGNSVSLNNTTVEILKTFAPQTEGGEDTAAIVLSITPSGTSNLTANDICYLRSNGASTLEFSADLR